jgi:hypothetical protein
MMADLNSERNRYGGSQQQQQKSETSQSGDMISR